MSQKAPLQNRFGKAMRRRRSCIQLGDRRIMLLARENDLADDVIFQRVESFVVANELLREGGGSGERFAAIEAVAVIRLLFVGGGVRRSRAMFVTGGSSSQWRDQAGHGTMIGGQKPGGDSQQSDRRAKEARERPLLHGVFSQRILGHVQLLSFPLASIRKRRGAIPANVFVFTARRSLVPRRFVRRSNQLGLKALRLLHLRPMS